MYTQPVDTIAYLDIKFLKKRLSSLQESLIDPDYRNFQEQIKSMINYTEALIDSITQCLLYAKDEDNV